MGRQRLPATRRRIVRHVPISVDGLNEVAAIGAGGVESLALLKNGTVMEWGRFSQVPTAVSGLEEVSAIGAGGR